MNIDLITDSQPKFTITINGIQRKIFTYFTAASDGSIAFHFYLDGKYSGEIGLGRDFGGGIIDLNQMIRRDDFIIHKINFHRSGEVTTKNNKGEKFGNEKSYSVFLENFMDGENDLSFLQPTEWDAYPIVQDEKKYVELTKGNLNVLPPIVQFYIAKDETRIINAHQKIRKTINWFVDENVLRPFGLKLYISVRSHKDGKYPPQQIFAVYQYDRH